MSQNPFLEFTLESKEGCRDSEWNKRNPEYQFVEGEDLSKVRKESTNCTYLGLVRAQLVEEENLCEFQNNAAFTDHVY